MAPNELKDEVCTDEAALRDKQKVLRLQQRNAMFYSSSDTFKFLAGVMLAAGMAIVGSALRGVTTWAGVASSVGGEGIGLAFLGAAAVCMAVAVGSQYIASHYFHNATYDQFELNAQHTAKYLVKEIKKENACIADQQPSARADGKRWTQYEQTRRESIVLQQGAQI